ncbi:hypothetical protein MesoLj113c_31820 [Mesorhizobium sp. 113-3-9]|nr:hypothetical protein MesoLj113c_31820 [Mesorhizobium sp. 113-3-9]
MARQAAARIPGKGADNSPPCVEAGEHAREMQPHGIVQAGCESLAQLTLGAEAVLYGAVSNAEALPDEEIREAKLAEA